MNSNAAGQLFGYSLQYPRALLRLLEADSDASVAVEVFGDVSVITKNGNILSEEDKSSIASNPLTNLSINLWKTFFNWVVAINNRELDPEIDRFVLYANHKIPEKSLVMEFNNSTETTVDEVLKHADLIVKDIPKKHKIYEYKEYLLKKNRDNFKALLPRFELVFNPLADNVYDDIKKILKDKTFIDATEIEWVLNYLTGWLQTAIMGKISKNIPAILSKEYFTHELRPLLSKLRKKELIDFALSKMPTEVQLINNARQRPIYIKQLEYINSSDDEIIEAVSNYFKADSNRLDWIDKEIITESDMDDFEKKLCSFHNNTNNKIRLTRTTNSDEERGKLLYSECQNRKESLSNQDPPHGTIQGSYHVLSDEERLGWHPNWKILLKA
jgi:hypothetical protein